jgi:hypothetical protein
LSTILRIDPSATSLHRSVETDEEHDGATVMTRELRAGPNVWNGHEIEEDPSWIIRLEPGMVEELEDLVRSTSNLERPFEAEDFPFDRCSAVIEHVVSLLSHGPGLALVRGLPRERFTDAECERIYWAFGMHLGNPVRQNSAGDRLGHVRDTGKSIDDPNIRVYQTNIKLDYHADQLPVDVLGLFCLRVAMRGGASKIVSASTIHNVVAQERPDLLEVLYEPFNVDWRGEEADGDQPWYQMPMFSVADGKLASRFASLAYFRSVDRFGPEFAVRPVQMEALEFVQAVANRPGMAMSMMFEEGDMQFLNNHVMLHAREAFEDDPDPAMRRHLLRMWISYRPENRQPLSPLLAERYRYVEAGGMPIKTKG